MIRSRAWVVLALFGLSLFGGLATGRDLFFSLAYLWGGLLLTSWIWARSSLLGLTLEREARSSAAQVGSVFEERLILRNRSRVPKLWVEIRDRSTLPGYWATPGPAGMVVDEPDRRAHEIPGHRVSSVIASLGAGREVRWLVRTRCTLRGRYRLGPASLESGDPFGLFTISKDATPPQYIIVLPATDPITEFDVPSGYLPGGGALHQRTNQVTANAVGVRDYAPGDGLNRIHWRSTARRDRLIVKEFEIDPKVDVWIVLDAAGNTQSRTTEPEEAAPKSILPRTEVRLPPDTEEYAVAAAASLAFHLLSRDRAVGLVAYGHVRHVIQANRGQPQLNQILETLATLEASGRLSIEEVIRIEAPRFPRGATAVLITPDPRTELLLAAQELERRRVSPVLVLLDAESFGGAPGSAQLASRASQRGLIARLIRYGDKVGAAMAGAPPALPSWKVA
jgi:uncharacterized protein (DUF58 family)